MRMHCNNGRFLSLIVPGKDRATAMTSFSVEIMIEC